MNTTEQQGPTPQGVGSNDQLGGRLRSETDCEDQGFSSVSEGCNNWPCYRTPLVKWQLGWRCQKCGGCY